MIHILADFTLPSLFSMTGLPGQKLIDYMVINVLIWGMILSMVVLILSATFLQ